MLFFWEIKVEVSVFSNYWGNNVEPQVSFGVRNKIEDQQQQALYNPTSEFWGG